jgi:predicted DCC family thiol-disulfide oxidoreductase YuxK
VSSANANPIVLYDGVCGLCNRLVQFVLKRDKKDVFRFAALQSSFARALLARHGYSTDDLNTVYVVLDPGSPVERLLRKSGAIAFILEQLGGKWRLLASFRLVPQIGRDLAYDLVARFRYPVFGNYNACPLPTPKDRAKFVGL